MGDVEIDIVGPEPLQALLDLMENGIPTEITVYRLAILVEEVIALLRVPNQSAFGRDNGLIPPPMGSDAEKRWVAENAVSTY